MNAQKFEELKVWGLARDMVNDIYTITKRRKFSRDYVLREEIRRTSISVMSNIAEGFERGSNKDFARFLYNAKGSIGEVRAQLYIAQDQGYLTNDEFKRMYKKTEEIGGMLGKLIQYLKRP